MATLHSSHSVQRLRFTSFDEEKSAPAKTKAAASETPAPAPLPPAPPPAPVFSEKDMEAARSEGHAQGYSEGYATAEAKLNEEANARETSIRSLLDVIANRITMAAESHAQFLKSQQEIMGKMALAVARKLSGEALRREPYANVEALLRECAGFIAGEPKITIAAPSALAAGLRQRIDSLRPLLPGFEGELLVEEDAQLGEQDCRVAWKNGYAEHDAQAVWNDITALIAKATIYTN